MLIEKLDARNYFSGLKELNLYEKYGNIYYIKSIIFTWASTFGYQILIHFLLAWSCQMMDQRQQLKWKFFPQNQNDGLSALIWGKVWTFFSEFYEFKIDFIYSLSYIYPFIICRPIYNFQLPLTLWMYKKPGIMGNKYHCFLSTFQRSSLQHVLIMTDSRSHFSALPSFLHHKQLKDWLLSLSPVVYIFVFFFITTIQVTPSIFLLFMISGFIKIWLVSLVPKGSQLL